LRIAVASAIALTIAAGVAGCGGGGGGTETTEPSIEKGRSFADDFVHRLIVVGRWKAVVDDTSPQVRKEIRKFQSTLMKNGVRKVVGPGDVRRNCPTSPVVGATNECIAYHLTGGYQIPITGQRVAIRARLRLWLEWINGRWRVLSYDYDAAPRAVPPGG
jgi:hypothetical protein